MNKNDLINEVASVANVTKADAGRCVEATFDTITNILKNGGQFIMPGFGTFSVGERAARTGRNPRTGEPIAIKAAKVPKFKAAKGLKDACQEEGSA